MSEIPEDIREKADKVWARIVWFTPEGSDAADRIARAILAERERCAKIADEFAKENWGFTEAEHAGLILAAAIRADTTQERTP